MHPAKAADDRATKNKSHSVCFLQKTLRAYLFLGREPFIHVSKPLGIMPYAESADLHDTRVVVFSSKLRGSHDSTIGLVTVLVQISLGLFFVGL